MGSWRRRPAGCAAHLPSPAPRGAFFRPELPLERPSLAVCACASLRRRWCVTAGLGDAEERTTPTSLPTMETAGAISVGCGAEYTLALAGERGDVYSWGWCAVQELLALLDHLQAFHASHRAVLPPIRLAASHGLWPWLLATVKQAAICITAGL